MTIVKSLGIFGGTFDPIHTGHLFMADQVRHAAGLDHIVFVPNGDPRHKAGNPYASAEHRFAMVSAAVKSNEYFSASRVEVDRPGPTYSIDTIRYFRRELVDFQNQIFIIGSDAVLGLHAWHDTEALAKEARFIGVSRPGTVIDERDWKEVESWANLTKWMTVSALAISSTDIRARVDDGQSIRYLTPDAVVDHILEHGLYSSPYSIHS